MRTHGQELPYAQPYHKRPFGRDSDNGARKKSGSLITASLGLEQGKEIFALPGRITDDLSAGCNELIQSGAGILTSLRMCWTIWAFFTKKVY